VVVENREQLFVVDVPKGPPGLVLTEESEVGEQLAESHVRGQLAHFG
jgi:hypothetical protein